MCPASSPQFEPSRGDEKPQLCVGLWRQDPSDPQTLVLSQLASNRIYTATLSVDPESGMVNRVSMRIEGHEGKQEQYSAERLNVALSGQVRQALLVRGSLDESAYLKQILRTFGRLISSEPLAHFAPSPSIIGKRLQTQPPSAVLQQLLDHPNVDSWRITEALSISPAAPLTQEELPILERLWRRLPTDQWGAFKGQLANAFVARGQPEFGAAFVLRAESASFYEPDRIKNLNFDCARVVFKAALSDSKKCKIACELLAQPEFVREQDGPRFASYVGEKLLSAGRMDFLPAILRSNYSHQPIPFLKGLSADLLYASLSACTLDEVRLINTDLALFPNADYQRAVGILVQREMAGETAPYLGRAKGLTLPVAEALLGRGYGKSVLSHLGSFRVSTAEAVGIIRQMLESLKIADVLESLQFLPEKVLKEADRTEFIAGYKRDIGLASPKLYAQYRVFSHNQNLDARYKLVRSVEALKEKIVSSVPHDENITKDPNYEEVAALLYHQRGDDFEEFEEMVVVDDGDEAEPAAGPLGSQSYRFCRDRSFDLAGMKYDPVYRINLASSIKMSLPEGITLDEAKLAAFMDPVEALKRRCEAIGYNKKIGLADLNAVIRQAAKLPSSIADAGAQTAAICLRFLEGTVCFQEMYQVVIRYHFLRHTAIREYVAATVDEAKRSPSSEHVALLNFQEFLSNRLLESIREAYLKFLDDPLADPLLERLYDKLSPKRTNAEMEQVFARHRVDRIGITPELNSKLLEVLSKRELPPAKRYAAVAGIIAAEQGKIARLRADVLGEEVRADDLALYSFRREALEQELKLKQVRERKAGSLRAYFGRALEEVLLTAKTGIAAELAKFRPEEQIEVQGRVVEAFFTKNLASVRARKVGGVCVAKDNPKNEGDEKNQWDMPNYFQLVLRDAQTKECLGLVLLHHYRENGKKILTASFNPSSTFLYKVDGRELFRGILRVLSNFAARNDFDYLGCSKQSHVRTNRVGGRFEDAIDETVRLKSAEFSLSQQQRFSYSPSYFHQHFDVLWEKGDPVE